VAVPSHPEGKMAKATVPSPPPLSSSDVHQHQLEVEGTKTPSHSRWKMRQGWLPAAATTATDDHMTGCTAEESAQEGDKKPLGNKRHRGRVSKPPNPAFTCVPAIIYMCVRAPSYKWLRVHTCALVRMLVCVSVACAPACILQCARVCRLMGGWVGRLVGVRPHVHGPAYMYQSVCVSCVGSTRTQTNIVNRHCKGIWQCRSSLGSTKRSFWMRERVMRVGATVRVRVRVSQCCHSKSLGDVQPLA